jgi:NADPH2:quinone reductase
VVDGLWAEPLRAAVEAAAPGARIVHVGQSTGPETTLASAAVRGKRIAILGYSYFPLTPSERAQAYREVTEHVVAGRIKVDVETFSLDEIADAWTAQQSGAKAVVLL